MVLDAAASAGVGALLLPVMPGTDAALGEAPDAELPAAGVFFGGGEVEAVHLSESGEAVGHAELHHPAIDGTIEASLVENADDASEPVLRLPNPQGEALALRDATESVGRFPTEGLVVFRRVNGM